jgi:hypothetical protein
VVVGVGVVVGVVVGVAVVVAVGVGVGVAVGVLVGVAVQAGLKFLATKGRLAYEAGVGLAVASRAIAPLSNPAEGAARRNAPIERAPISKNPSAVVGTRRVCLSISTRSSLCPGDLAKRA